jgi:endonuclease YncB( thermonuclease family)
MGVDGCGRLVQASPSLTDVMEHALRARRAGLRLTVMLPAVLATSVGTSMLAACSPATDDALSDGGGVVVDVIDGDTIEVDGVGRVRLVGVDTPEMGDCGYDAARDQLAALVLGESVQLVHGGVDDRDRYDRLLRYVDVDGVDAGLLLIEEGLAVSRYDSRDGYGEHRREQTYVEADADAADVRLCAPAR